MKKKSSLLYFILGFVAYFLFKTLKTSGLPAFINQFQGFLGSKIFAILLFAAVFLALVLIILKRLLER